MRLHENQAKKEILRLVREGDVGLTAHAKSRMKERNLTTNDVLNVLRAGAVSRVELDEKSAQWRYTVATERMGVVVVMSEANLTVITAWRNES